LNNLGPGLGVVADNFASMNPVAKWILIANMLFGRLEVFTLLVKQLAALLTSGGRVSNVWETA
ncbi:hypothetical protein MJM43_30520, partial [Salmonella enterica subsp. enterica serovar Montevideo]|nr:hypothetical protein [Salmonella enterica subsp. enterica serovar Montevideo]